MAPTHAPTRVIYASANAYYESEAFRSKLDQCGPLFEDASSDGQLISWIDKVALRCGSHLLPLPVCSIPPPMPASL